MLCSRRPPQLRGAWGGWPPDHCGGKLRRICCSLPSCTLGGTGSEQKV